MFDKNKFTIFSNELELASELCKYIEKRIYEVISERGYCNIIIPGGTSPRLLFKNLSQLSLPWSLIRFFLSDERCLPLNHEQRNDRVFNNYFLSCVDSKSIFFNIPAELGQVEGVKCYESVLNKNSLMDIVILGIGEDGHIASLFPNNKALKSKKSCVEVSNAPKPPKNRISIGLDVIKNASERIILVIGSSKIDALMDQSSYKSKPVSMIGRINFYFSKTTQDS
jgi:6-phosphogluconolactonase